MQENKILIGDTRKILKTLPSEPVNCCVTSPPRNSNGKFLKGYKYSEKTQFQKGQHWRKYQIFRNKDWLIKEYIINKRSAKEIADEFNITENAIYFWLNKHSIKTRNISEVRKIKKWGLHGKTNGMYGRTGKNNPNWNGGHSSERQTMYARSAWKEIAKEILKRDNYKCKKCGLSNKKHNKLVVHHIKQWSKYPELRFEKNNLITVCEECHKKEHYRR